MVNKNFTILIFFIFVYLVLLFLYVFYRDVLARKIDDIDNIKTDMILNAISLLFLSPIIFIGWYSLIIIPIIFILISIIFTCVEVDDIKLDKQELRDAKLGKLLKNK